jgi:hypothetical protein
MGGFFVWVIAIFMPTDNFLHFSAHPALGRVLIPLPSQVVAIIAGDVELLLGNFCRS